MAVWQLFYSPDPAASSQVSTDGNITPPLSPLYSLLNSSFSVHETSAKEPSLLSLAVLYLLYVTSISFSASGDIWANNLLFSWNISVLKWQNIWPCRMRMCIQWADSLYLIITNIPKPPLILSAPPVSSVFCLQIVRIEPPYSHFTRDQIDTWLSFGLFILWLIKMAEMNAFHRAQGWEIMKLLTTEPCLPLPPSATADNLSLNIEYIEDMTGRSGR